jgi:hypothetical protein
MRNIAFIIVLLFLSRICGYCLTENSRISILTAEPGKELYTIFGHTAIRITDETLQIDKIYNFGTFDFSSPFFYIKFIRGNLDYFLSVSNFGSFKYYSRLEHRRIFEQILHLSQAEKVSMYNNLERCYNSSDRYYKYNFFYDNCATRVRDVILDTGRDILRYDTSQFCCLTFRQLIKPYISKNYWIDLGVNLVLGRQADRNASSVDFMFLPDYIRAILQNSGITGISTILLDYSDVSGNNRKNSLLLLWLIVGFISCLLIIKKTQRIACIGFNLLVGMVGLILLFLGMVSENPAFMNNLNILWTLPALIIVLIPYARMRKAAQIIYIFLLLGVPAFGQIFSQAFSATFIPWILLLIAMQVIDLQWIKKRMARAG